MHIALTVPEIYEIQQVRVQSTAKIYIVKQQRAVYRQKGKETKIYVKKGPTEGKQSCKNKRTNKVKLQVQIRPGPLMESKVWLRVHNWSTPDTLNS